MKKIVSNVLIVSTQLIIGGLFLFMLFSDSNEDKKNVVVENDNLNKMADAVSELFVADQLESSVSLTNETKVVDLISEEERKAKEEAEAKAKAEEEAKLKAEAEAKAKAEEEARLKAEAEKKAKEEAAKSVAVDNSVASLQAYAHDLVINSYGWSEVDFTALVSLWNRESGWNYSASNGSAYGIPQAYPASKMSSAGSDYLTNGKTQIRWGLGYIKSTYGNPSTAWNHFQNCGWY